MPYRKLIRWGIVIVGGVLVTLWIAALGVSSTPSMRAALVRTLNDKLDADVDIGNFDVKAFPLMRIHGDRLKLHLKSEDNSEPFVDVRHFEVRGGMAGLFRRPRRFSALELDGLRITIPPRGPHDHEEKRGSAMTAMGPTIVDHVEAKDAQLVILPKNPQKEPKVFAIHNVMLESAGFDRAMPFTATLTNALPKGEIATKGSFGPWVKHDPGGTPVNGHYSFERAELNTIDGIGGILQSTGDFSGTLSEIDVRGTTSTPDFSLDTAGMPVPLDTTFHALVDGTNGDTYLKQVKAKLVETPIVASGAVVSIPNVKGRSVKVDVVIDQGRIQDVLRLAVKSRDPVMLGRLALRSALEVPPGKARVLDRMRLAGRFALQQAQFTDAGVQQQLASLSRRARGQSPDEAVGRIVSDMSGDFTLREGAIRFRTLRFSVPGATVELSGVYAIRSESLDFMGTLAMDAPVSKAIGGLKSLLLKPFDPLFRKRGKGAVVPITIKGTRSDPKFGVDWRKVFH